MSFIHYKLSPFILLLSLLFISACRQGEKDQVNRNYIKVSGETMGTFYEVTYLHPEKREFSSSIDSLLREFNQSVSTYIQSSTISNFNYSETGIEADYWLSEVTRISLEVAEKTDGAFDPTVMHLVNAWGFGYEEKQKPDSVYIDSVLQFTGFHKVNISDDNLIYKDRPEVKLDMGGIAKGYGVDVTADWLESMGVTDYYINFGGDIRTKGKNPVGKLWRIGIETPDENPEKQNELYSIIQMKNKALATSGNYRNYHYRDGKRYGHTIDPVSGYPALHNLLSVSVFHPLCVYADAYATAFLVLGLEQSIELVEKTDKLEAYLIYQNDLGELKHYYSPGLEEFIERKKD